MQSSFALDGAVAVVTGALGLLGRAHCRALAQAGARVVAADLDGDACDGFARDLAPHASAGALGHALDVTDAVSIRRLCEDVEACWGPIDVLVNNAAIDDRFVAAHERLELSRFENYPLELWQRSLAVNVTGTFLCCQGIGPHMATRGHGSIINIASTYGLVAPDPSLYRRPDGSQAFFKSAAYPTGKGAVLAFTRFLAAYWGGAGVRVNSLSPGGVENGQEDWFVKSYASRTPLGRMARPSDYSGALVFLASDASRYMTGANLVVDGGWTIW